MTRLMLKFLHDILRSKDNQTLKFSQLMKYNMGNIFREKHKQNLVEKPFSDPLIKNWNWSYCWINSLRFYKLVFIVCQLDGNRSILKLTWRALICASYKAFVKNKRWCGTSLPASFYAWFLKKNIYLVIFYKLIKSDCLVDFTLVNMCIVTVC